MGEAAKRTVGSGANQLPDMAYFASSISGNGYSKLPSGLIIQWGSFAVTTNYGVVNSLSVTLPVVFPASILMVNAMFSTQDPSTRFVGFDTAKSSRGVINFTYVTPTTNTIYWIAFRLLKNKALAGFKITVITHSNYVIICLLPHRNPLGYRRKFNIRFSPRSQAKV
ncbi:hypothetical protein [Enterobacter hormaechei]|uniref:gp53-like domain-containing protein n=1 Tax=Enterobacter hormaechei TaxID=158836 RepID=UPI0022EC7126|nr:hypothetical protein [Enterobacter hormaechei]WBT22664.1 hypothetical protein PF325_18310 [Enterobacter hormaechei]